MTSMNSNGYWCVRSGGRFFFPKKTENATGLAPIADKNIRSFYASTL